MASPFVSPTASVTVEPETSPTASPTVSPTASPTTAESCTVEIGNFRYEPNPIEIPAGTTVTWTNNHTTQHSATADDNDASGAPIFDTTLLDPNQSSAPISFDTPGVFP
jgi:plastocyanin